MPDDKYIRRRITITFTSFENNVGVSDEEFASALNYELQDWYEGRYPFEVEMIKEGLSRVVASSVGKAVHRRCQEELGNAMVPFEIEGMKGHMSAAHVEAGERMKNFSSTIGILDARDEASVITISTERDDDVLPD